MQSVYTIRMFVLVSNLLNHSSGCGDTNNPSRGSAWFQNGSSQWRGKVPRGHYRLLQGLCNEVS